MMQEFVRHVGIALALGPGLSLAACASLSGEGQAVAGREAIAPTALGLTLPAFLQAEKKLTAEEQARQLEARIEAHYLAADALRAKLVALRGGQLRSEGVEQSLYAEAPRLEGGVSLFFEAEMGEFPTRSAAEGEWRRLSLDPSLASYNPRYHVLGGSVLLSVGPMTAEADVAALCRAVEALAPDCRLASPESAWRHNG
jgi:hypothetical protein